MQSKLAVVALAAAAAVLAAPAVFAQQSTTVVQTTVMGAPAAVVVTPGVAAPVPQRPIHRGTIAEAVPGVTVASGVPVTTYYFNVDHNIQRRADFMRWRRLIS